MDIITSSDAMPEIPALLQATRSQVWDTEHCSAALSVLIVSHPGKRIRNSSGFFLFLLIIKQDLYSIYENLKDVYSIRTFG